MSLVLEQARKLQAAGRVEQAETLYRALLRNRPDHAAAHCDLGRLLHRIGRHAEAATHYQNALAHDPAQLEARIALSQLRVDEGDMHAALTELQAAHGAAPGNAEVLEGLGLVLLHLGRNDEAIPLHEALLVQRPDDMAARTRLANALFAQAQPADALAIHRQLHRQIPDNVDVMVNLANALDAARQYDEAVGFYRQALAGQPGHAEALYNLGNCWLHQDRLDDAIACYRQALAHKADYPAAEENLGLALCRHGALEEAMAVFAALGARHVPQDSAPHKVRHDVEQREYLATSPAGTGARVSGPAIDPGNADAAQAEWNRAVPKIAVIDNLLTPAALEGLRHYLWSAPVWQRAYRNGYLGAMPLHGLAAPLLAQIAADLAATFPAIFAGHPLRYYWAFKYESRLPGIAIHADQAAVNVNFWLTPDSANRDPKSGGMKIWDVAAPADWDFETYNADGQAIRDFLAREKAREIIIPYRANRAVIFDSDLFHETDQIDFEDGYRNRRINMTMLYGKRTATDR